MYTLCPKAVFFSTFPGGSFGTVDHAHLRITPSTFVCVCSTLHNYRRGKSPSLLAVVHEDPPTHIPVAYYRATSGFCLDTEALPCYYHVFFKDVVGDAANTFFRR